MPHTPDRRCIHCHLPADLRTGRALCLPNGDRIHSRCLHPHIIDLCRIAITPPRKPTPPHRPTQRRPTP